jgi:hypothetical protein
MTKKKQQLTEKLDGIGELAGLVLICKPESASGYTTACDRRAKSGRQGFTSLTSCRRLAGIPLTPSTP